jgi:hypothetical protein
MGKYLHISKDRMADAKSGLNEEIIKDAHPQYYSEKVACFVQ